MKAAIALFGKRISPRFDCAQNFMIITIDDHTVTDQTTQIIKEKQPSQKARCLANLNVDTVICGGVDEGSVQSLRFHGVKIVSGVKGDADKVLDLYLKGELNP